MDGGWIAGDRAATGDRVIYTQNIQPLCENSISLSMQVNKSDECPRRLNNNQPLLSLINSIYVAKLNIGQNKISLTKSQNILFTKLLKAFEMLYWMIVTSTNYFCR